MPVDCHRRCHGTDPLILLVSHLYNNMACITPSQPVCSNLSRQACRRLHSRVEVVKLEALAIPLELLPVQDIEIIAGHGTLLRVCSSFHVA